MKELEVLDLEIEFCYSLLEYRKYFESNLELVNKLNDTLDNFKKLGILQDVRLKRADTIMHNKLYATLKEFKKYNIDPLYFYDQASGDNYVSNFYSRYILAYLNRLVIEMYNHFNNAIDQLDVLTKDVKKLTNHFIKILISSVSGGNLILEDRRCLEDIELFKYEAHMYNTLLEKIYDFDIRRDYFEVVKMTLELINKSKCKDNREYAIMIQYNVDAEYLIKMGLPDKIADLRKIYIDYLNSIGISINILDFELEPYFINILPDSVKVMDYAKLNSQELKEKIRELENQKLMLLATGYSSGDAAKDAADVILLTNKKMT